MTDISHHISRLINDVFESSFPLNGTVIGMLNLLFNQGSEFIAVQKLCRCRCKCMIGLSVRAIVMLFAPVSSQYGWALGALCFPVDFSLTVLPPFITGCFSSFLQSLGKANWLIDSILCFHSTQAHHAALTVCEQRSHLFHSKMRLQTCS